MDMRANGQLEVLAAAIRDKDTFNNGQRPHSSLDRLRPQAYFNKQSLIWVTAWVCQKSTVV